VVTVLGLALILAFGRQRVAHQVAETNL
jgi:hypothetical protein